MSITLGYNNPTFQSAYSTGLNYNNQMAIKVTAPSGGITVTDLYAYFGGYGSTVSARLCIWNDDSNKSLNTQSSAFTAPSYGLGVGGQGWQHVSGLNVAFTGGTSFWIGWWRDPSGGQVWSEQNSAAEPEWLMTNTGSSPSALGTTNNAGSGIPGIYCVGTAGSSGAGGIPIWNGSAWVKHPPNTWNGSAWVTHPVEVWTGSSWQRVS